MVYTISMQRTQIYLPKSQLERLRGATQKRNTTVSAVIRAFLERQFQRAAPAVPVKYESLIEAARRINRYGKKAPRDLATNLDTYLYGGK